MRVAWRELRSEQVVRAARLADPGHAGYRRKTLGLAAGPRITGRDRVQAIRVALGERSYDIHITSDDPAGLGPFARQRTKGSAAFVVSDENVQAHAEAVAAALEGAGFRVSRAALPPGEQQ